MTAMPFSSDDAVPEPVERIPGDDVVAAFDFDGTLTRGGSVWKFLSAMRGRRVVALAAIPLTPKLVRAALFGGHAADEAKEALFRRTLAGLDAGEVARRAGDFGLRHYRSRCRIKVRSRLDWHRRQGHRLVIVSASPECYVGVVGQELGVDAVIATKLAVDERGRLTGRFDGHNCRGEQKLLRLRQWLEASPAALDGEGAHAHDAHATTDPAAPDRPGAGGPPFIWAYGNSAGDRRLLEAADIGIDAGKLGPMGKLRGFRRLGDVLTAW